MNGMDRGPQPGEQPKKLKMPNREIIQGLLAVVIGVVLLGITSYRLLLNVIFFVGGIVLIYRGLQWLKLTQVTDFLDVIVGSLKKVFKD